MTTVGRYGKPAALRGARRGERGGPGDSRRWNNPERKWAKWKVDEDYVLTPLCLLWGL